MPRTSDSDDDNPLPKGTRKGSYRGTSPEDASGPSFLYTDEVPLPPSEVKVKEKRKKKTKRQGARGVEDNVDAEPINEGQSFDTSQSFERSFESGISAGRTEAARTSANPSRLSFKNLEGTLSTEEVRGQGQSTDAGEAENDAKKGEDKRPKKIKFPIKLGNIFRKNKKAEAKDASSVVETELSAIPATLPSSGYLEPLSEGSSSYVPSTSYGAAQTQRPTTLLQGQRQTTTVSMPPVGEEEVEMSEVERLMKEKQKRISHRKICESVFLSVVLVAGFILGIILTAMSPLGVAFQIVGPTILGLSAFAIVGKIFVTVFWEEDPYLWTKGHVRKVTERHRPKKNHAPKPAAETHTSLMPNPTYGGDENAPSPPPPPEPDMTSDFGGDAINQYGGGRPPSFSFDSTFSQQEA